jgi:hypothetical protein
MNSVILKGAKLGAFAGFCCSFAYSLFATIISELYLPPYDPTLIGTFKADSYFLPHLLQVSFYAILLSTLMGATMGVGFGLILIRILSRKSYSLICILGCVLPATLLYVIPLTNLFLNPRHRIFELFPPSLFMFGILVVPAIIYALAGGYVSGSLYNSHGNYSTS